MGSRWCICFLYLFLHHRDRGGSWHASRCIQHLFSMLGYCRFGQYLVWKIQILWQYVWLYVQSGESSASCIVGVILPESWGSVQSSDRVLP